MLNAQRLLLPGIHLRRSRTFKKKLGVGVKASKRLHAQLFLQAPHKGLPFLGDPAVLSGRLNERILDWGVI